MPWQRAGRRGARTYTPTQLARYETLVAWKALAARQQLSVPWPLDAKYAILVDAYCADGRRGDFDNLLKTPGDACQARRRSKRFPGAPGVLWKNDHQIVDGRVRVYEGCEQPFARIHVAVVDGPLDAVTFAAPQRKGTP